MNCKGVTTGLLVVCAIAIAIPSAASAQWLTSYDRAVEQARRTDRPILVNFTGSDWCGWCIRLKNEVFDTEQFRDWAGRNVVLLEVDLPRATQLPADLHRQNEQLRQRFNIRGFPTVLFLNQEGREIGRSGYIAGGPQPWIASAERIIAAAARPTPPPAAAPALDVFASLASGMTHARTQNRPLLVIVDPNCDQRVTRLLENRQFAQLAMRELVVVHLSGVLDETQAQTVGQLQARCAAGTEPANVMLLDRSQNSLLFSRPTVGEPREMVQAIRRALPAPTRETMWMTNYQQALELAAQTDRPIVLYFTGRDWCGWCVRLDEEILSTAPFRDYAADNLVLVMLDFPRDMQLPPELRRQNEQLRQRHNVTGFPSMVVLSPQGNRLGQIGYMRGGPSAFLPRLQEIVDRYERPREPRGISIRIRI